MTDRVEAAMSAALQHYLPRKDTPIAIGFSGGGDSTALLHALRDRVEHVHVFIVDHGLRAGAMQEAQAARFRAQQWGFQAEILTWKPELLRSGVQEKARHARYGLIGDKMRERAISYLLTGHTEDDQAETCLMRYERSTDWRGAAGMATSVYAPVWPELAEITVLRPLLGLSRAALRSYNNRHNLEWAEDPSNQNRKFTRIRARDNLEQNQALRAHLLNAAVDLQAGLSEERQYLRDWMKRHADVHLNGYIQLGAIPPSEALLHLIRAVSGQGDMIDKAKLKSLRRNMAQTGFKGATLGGAHILKTKQSFILVCDPAHAKGRRGTHAIAPMVLKQGPQIWDGRFLVHYSGADKLMLCPAWGHINRFEGQFSSVPAAARPTLPLVINEAGACIAFGAHNAQTLKVKWLGAERLEKTLA